MTTEMWITLYVALGLGWAILSAKQIIPMMRHALYDTPVNIKGMTEKRASEVKDLTVKFKKRIQDSMLPDSWIVPILSISIMLICLERGLFWPISVVKYVIKRRND